MRTCVHACVCVCDVYGIAVSCIVCTYVLYVHVCVFVHVFSVHTYVRVCLAFFDLVVHTYVVSPFHRRIL